MQHVRDLIRQLANFDPGDALVLSVYLDMRPHGASPARRPSLIMLTDRVRQLEKTLLPRGAALDHFRIDANRAQRFLDEHTGPWLQGVAIFACNSHQLEEVIETGVPFENQVVLEPVPKSIWSKDTRSSNRWAALVHCCAIAPGGSKDARFQRALALAGLYV